MSTITFFFKFQAPMFTYSCLATLVCCGLLISINPAQATQNLGKNQAVKWTTSINSYSPAQPIQEFANEWTAPLNEGDFAFVQTKTAVDYRKMLTDGVKNVDSIGFGLAARYDYLLEFNQPTAQVYWQYKNNKPLASNQNYPLHLKAIQNQRWGVNVFTDLVFANKENHWRLTPRLNIWKGTKSLDGEITGNILTASAANNLPENGKIYDNILTVDKNIHYYYDTPVLQEEKLKWQPNKPDGYGYSLDIALTGKITDKLTVSSHAYDLLGKMHWQDMPMTDYQLDYDALGRPLYSLEGQLDTQDFEQVLPWQLENKADFQLNKEWSLSASNQTNQLSSLTQLSSNYHANVSLGNVKEYPIKISTIIEPESKSFGVAASSDHFGVKWLADDININQAKRGDVSFHINYAW